MEYQLVSVRSGLNGSPDWVFADSGESDSKLYIVYNLL